MQEAVMMSGQQTQISTKDLPSRALDTLNGMVDDIEAFLKTKIKPLRHFSLDWQQGIIPVSSSFKRDNKDLEEKLAIEQVCKKYGDDFQFRSILPQTVDTASEFLQKYGKTAVKLDRPGYDSENGVQIELDNDKKLTGLTLFHQLPNAPKFTTPEGQTWQLARAEKFLPTKFGYSILTHNISFIRLPQQKA